MTEMALAYPVCGFVVGGLVGFTGIGGGSIMTPLLILLFGVPRSQPSAPIFCMPPSPR